MKRSRRVAEAVVPGCHPVHDVVGDVVQEDSPICHTSEQIQSEISAFHRERGENLHLEEILLHHFPDIASPAVQDGASITARASLRLSIRIKRAGSRDLGDGSGSPDVGGESDVTGTTKLYPRPGTFAMYRLPGSL